METEFQRIQEQIDRQNKNIEAFQNENRWLKRILLPVGVLSLLSIGSFLWSSDITVPHTFSSGTLIQASSINSNFSTIYSHSNQLSDNLSTLQQITPPVGSIVPSMLNENQFKAQIGDPSTFSSSSSKWTLADGRAISGSTYSTVTSQPNAPDLRGMFLRGLNAGRSDGNQDPEGGSRTIGNYQADQVRSHNHNNGSFDRLMIANGLYTTNGAVDNTGPPEVNLFTSATINAFGGTETRPRNIAVNYYIRIN
ncbi:MAG: hypothetical protein VW995_18890 [Deltaproteobacteria bacterium]